MSEAVVKDVTGFSFQQCVFNFSKVVPCAPGTLDHIFKHVRPEHLFSVCTLLATMLILASPYGDLEDSV